MHYIECSNEFEEFSEIAACGKNKRAIYLDETNNEGSFDGNLFDEEMALIAKMVKNSEISEDDLKKILNEVQKLTDSSIEKIDELLKVKKESVGGSSTELTVIFTVAVLVTFFSTALTEYSN